MDLVKERVKLGTELDISEVRKVFPILTRRINGNPLTYLDNAASSQKPLAVIIAIERFYSSGYANVHRGIHTLSEQATSDFEGVRRKISRFINASSSNEIIFVRGATEAINLVAQSYARPLLKPGDEILTTAMEHHSNIVPWQLLCEQTGAKLHAISIHQNGELDLEVLESMLESGPRLLALTHVSNVLGTVNPVKEIIALAHRYGVPVLVDGAQATPHMKIDVQDLDCDFYAFSGHKMYGPTGIGILYGKESILDQMPPYHGGGEMIQKVSFEGTTYKGLPYKFEAGTPHIAGVMGLGEAVEYLEGIGLEKIQRYERRLLQYGQQQLGKIEGLNIIGQAPHKAGIISFTLKDVHPHDVATVLDQQGIAVRAGHHCAMPLMEYLDLPATTRASFALYNTFEEIDRLVEGLHKAQELFG